MSERTILGAPARYETGLREVGDGVHVWLQPNGGLGESNAGLVVGDGESLLIDTLWDLRLTRRMLDAMAPLCREAPIRTLVNTHADGDHCWGNQLLAQAQIIGTTACSQDMLEEDPAALERLRGLGRLLSAVPTPPLPGLGALRGLKRFVAELRAYDFAGIELRPPTRTFDDTLELEVGGRRVELIEVGPAHTPGDLIVHLPDAGVVFAADVMFIGVAPIMWVGPVERWLAALERIARLQPRVVVPGHGPPGGLEDVARMRGYWELVAREVRSRIAAGRSPAQAAREILELPDFAEYRSWDNPERLLVNAAIIARGDAGGSGRVSPRKRAALIAEMGALAAALPGG